MFNAADLRIRKSALADIESVFKVVNDAYKVVVGESGESFRKVGRFESIDEVMKINHTLWVAERQEEIVGVVGMKLQENVVEIGPLAVPTRYQRMGIGGKLLDFAESQGEISRLSTASVRLANIAMYTKRGYKVVREVPVTEYESANIFSRSDLKIIHWEKSCI